MARNPGFLIVLGHGPAYVSTCPGLDLELKAVVGLLEAVVER